MRSRDAVRQGARRVSGNKRLIAILWVSHLCLAALLAAPVMTYLTNQMGHSRMPAEMLKDLDPMMVVELFSGVNDGKLLTTTVSIGLIALGALFLWSVVFAAGAVGRLANGGGFFEEAGRHFWKFARLFLLFVPFLMLLAGVNGGLDKVADRIWGEGMEEAPLVWFDRLRLTVMALLLGWLMTGFDYAKVRLAMGRNQSAIAAGFEGLWFVTRNLGTTMGAWLTVSAFGLLFFLLWSVGEHTLTGRGMGAILFLLAMQQLYVLSRIWIRAMYWSAAVEIETEEGKKNDESKAVFEYVAGGGMAGGNGGGATGDGAPALGEAEGAAAG